MDVVDLAPEVTPDRRAVVFRLCDRDRDIECTITREALEEHFWLPPAADESRALKTFADGRRRILAMAERRARARTDRPVRLTTGDFVARR